MVLGENRRPGAPHRRRAVRLQPARRTGRLRRPGLRGLPGQRQGDRARPQRPAPATRHRGARRRRPAAGDRRRPPHHQCARCHHRGGGGARRLDPRDHHPRRDRAGRGPGQPEVRSPVGPHPSATPAAVSPNADDDPHPSPGGSGGAAQVAVGATTPVRHRHADQHVARRLSARALDRASRPQVRSRPVGTPSRGSTTPAARTGSAFLRGDTSAQVADVPVDGTSAVVTTIPAGSGRGLRGGGGLRRLDVLLPAEQPGGRSSPTPDAPGGVNVGYVSDTGSDDHRRRELWSTLAANGSATPGYEVTATASGSQTRPRVRSGSQVDCQGACWSVRVDVSVAAVERRRAPARPAAGRLHPPGRLRPCRTNGDGGHHLSWDGDPPLCWLGVPEHHVPGPVCNLSPPAVVARLHRHLHRSPQQRGLDHRHRGRLRRRLGRAALARTATAYAFSVRACDDGVCVTSNTVQVTTSPAETGELVRHGPMLTAYLMWTLWGER